MARLVENFVDIHEYLNPILYIIFPRSLLEDGVDEVLKYNSDKVVTPFDIYNMVTSISGREKYVQIFYKNM